MSIDAVALLRIPAMAAPLDGLGHPLHIEHRGDATLLHTFVRFRDLAPDEWGLALRTLLGGTLDAHDDPRGVLIFPDVAESEARTYATLVSELAECGVWSPIVPSEHVPVRYEGAEPGSHDALLGAMIAVMGRDEAEMLDLMASVGRMGVVGSPDRADFAAQYAAQIDLVRVAMGEEFAARYAGSLARKVAAELAAAARPPLILE